MGLPIGLNAINLRWYEMQIVYKDESDKLQCLCLDLHDWTIAITHIGNMQCNI